MRGAASGPSVAHLASPIMSDHEIEQRVIDHLDALRADYTVMECHPDLADTAAFCKAYGVAPEDSANAILVASRRPPGQFSLNLVLAPTRLDVNRQVRNLMGVKKLSFANADVTAEMTGMLIGGVTPFGLSDSIPTYVDSRVMDRDEVIVGGGSRSKKIRVKPEVFDRMEQVTIVEDLALDVGPSSGAPDAPPR